MLKLLILDRDGVINYDSDAYIKSVAGGFHCPVRSRPSRS